MARWKKRKKKGKRRPSPAPRSAPALPPLELDPAAMLSHLAELLKDAPPGTLEALLGEVGEGLAGSLLPDPGFFEDPFDDALDEPPLHEEAEEIEPASPERCAPPLRLRVGGGVAPDPYATLGLAPGASPDAVRGAFRRLLGAAPPEDAQDVAERLNDARSLLLDPERVVERVLGEVRVPDPDAWGLQRGEASPDEASAMTSPARMAAQLLLYALVEEELLDEPRRPSKARVRGSQQPLFD